MKLYLHENHELPLVGGLVMVRTGTVFDPPDRIGLAAIAGSLLRTGGTALKAGDELDSQLQNCGAVIDSIMAESAGLIGFTSLKSSSDAALALFKEMLTQPEFRQNPLERAKTQMRAGIARRNDDPGAAARRELAALIYGKDTPYGWQPQYDTIDRVTRVDLKNFYKRYFFPANMSFGLWGDFDSAVMKTTIEKLFADWNPEHPPVPEFPAMKSTPAPGIFLAEKKDAPQTYIAAGHLAGLANQKDAAALEIMGLAFNGLQVHINQQAKAKVGTASGINLLGVAVSDVNAAWNSGFDHPGIFRISAATRGASTADAIRAVKEDIDRVRTTELTDEEIKQAKDAALNTLMQSWDSPQKAFVRQMAHLYYGYPGDFVQQYQAAVMAVTKADVMRAARQSLNPANLTLLVVGNPQVFTEPLEKLTPEVNRVDLAIPGPTPFTSETTDTSLADGKKMLARAQEASGGVEKLSAVKDFTEIAEYNIDPAGPVMGGARIKETDRWIAPTLYRQEMELPIGSVFAYTDGKVGWISAPQGWGALVGAQRKQVEGDLFRAYIRLLLSDRIEGRTVNSVDQDLLEITDTAGQVARMEMDSATGLPRSISYDVVQAKGAPVASMDTLSDFREVGGIKLPFKRVVNQAGRKFADVTVTEFKINTGLKVTDLSRRPQ
jgi:zinc protease